MNSEDLCREWGGRQQSLTEYLHISVHRGKWHEAKTNEECAIAVGKSLNKRNNKWELHICQIQRK